MSDIADLKLLLLNEEPSTAVSVTIDSQDFNVTVEELRAAIFDVSVFNSDIFWTYIDESLMARLGRSASTLLTDSEKRDLTMLLRSLLIEARRS